MACHCSNVFTAAPSGSAITVACSVCVCVVHDRVDGWDGKSPWLAYTP
jgi:hypothetical protein